MNIYNHAHVLYAGPSSSKQVFRVKKLVGLPPQLELLADSVTRQVHDNLFKLAHTESSGMHIASLMQGHTDTHTYFFLSFAHSELHQTILLFIPSHIVCFLLEDRNTIRRYFSLKCRHPNVQKLFSFCARCMASSYGNIDR